MHLYQWISLNFSRKNVLHSLLAVELPVLLHQLLQLFTSLNKKCMQFFAFSVCATWKCIFATTDNETTTKTLERNDFSE